jgi:SagB-type dehydrogenase family enzyme
VFRDLYPAAWTLHHNTIRWPFNTLEPNEEPWAGPPFKEYAHVPSITLPGPRDVGVPLGEAIRRRVSCRAFRAAPLALDELSTILSLGYGVLGVVHLGAREHLERPVPSGGGLYPLEFYLIVRQVDGLQPGLYHYAPLTHALERLKQIEFSDPFISQLFMNQPYLAAAGVVLIITAVVDRLMHKYADRGYRYILLEAGHAAQNMCLAAASLDLGALPLGGFFDRYLADLLQLDLEEEAILYGLGLGRPATADRVAARNLEALLGG